MAQKQISGKTIGRLGFYRRIVDEALGSNEQYLHSHELAIRAGVSAAQVRRDLMVTGFSGSPNRGYELRALHDTLSHFLDSKTPQHVALVGVGNLGRALISYFSGGRSNLVISAAFDADPEKAGRLFHGCRCYKLDEMQDVLKREKIKIAILTVPAEAARGAASKLVAADVKSILNFAPIPLRVPEGVYVENLDVTMYLEKAAFFARQKS